MSHLQSSIGRPELADQVAQSVRPLLVPMVLEGLGRNTIANKLNALRVAGPGAGQWTKLSVRRVLERLGLDDVRASVRASKVA